MFDYFLFGKKTAKRRSKKKSTKSSKSRKPPKALLTKCKNNGVRVTVKSGGKRMYKSVKVLEKQCVVKKIRKRTKQVISEVTEEVKKPMSVNRKNVLKTKMRAAAIALGGLKSSRRVLSQRYPGDKGEDIKQSTISPERKKAIRKKFIAASKLLKKPKMFDSYPTVPPPTIGESVSDEKKNNFGFSYYNNYYY